MKRATSGAPYKPHIHKRRLLRKTASRAAQPAPDRPYNLATWNIDYSSPLPGQRLSAIISHILSLSPPADNIFLQEVCHKAFSSLLSEPPICRAWYLSDADSILPAGQPFTAITLLSKCRFQAPKPGPVWRVKYSSRFGRDALCCNIFAPSSASARLRLVKVRHDSLPIQPSLHPPSPLPQNGSLSLPSCCAVRGGRVVAGDFNPVLPGDETLVQENGPVDAWIKLRPGEDGFTWGIDGREPFPPKWMDTVATVGVVVGELEVLEAGVLKGRHGRGGGGGEEVAAWSDHAGLRCLFKIEM